MNKVIWFKVNWKNQFDILKKSISNYSLDDSGTGFFLDTVRNDFIQGVFIEKKIESLNIENVDGSFTEIKNVKTLKTKFKLSNTTLGLVLYNPPRSISKFINFLSKSTNYRISLKKYDLDLLNIYKKMKDEFPHTDIIHATINDIVLSNTSNGKIIIKGKKDIYDLIGKYKTGVLKEIELLSNDNDLKNFKCIINKGGTCKIIESDLDYKNIVKILELYFNN